MEDEKRSLHQRFRDAALFRFAACITNQRSPLPASAPQPRAVDAGPPDNLKIEERLLFCHEIDGPSSPQRLARPVFLVCPVTSLLVAFASHLSQSTPTVHS